MLDLIMKFFGYENIYKIKIQKNYKIPRTEKLRSKANFYVTTGKFQDAIVINKDNVLLDGYVTFQLCKWANKKYVKVIKMDADPEKYKNIFRAYRMKSNERMRENENNKN